MNRAWLIVLHFLNPLHFYCYLIKIGISRKLSLSLSRVYEKILHKPIIAVSYQINIIRPRKVHNYKCLDQRLKAEADKANESELRR